MPMCPCSIPLKMSLDLPSAFYELIEWWIALLSEEAADAFLGTQGYIWDTQSDMGWALLGAITSLLCLSKLHNQQLNNIINRQSI